MFNRQSPWKHEQLKVHSKILNARLGRFTDSSEQTIHNCICMKPRLPSYRLGLFCLALGLLAGFSPAIHDTVNAAETRKTQNVFLVTSDGLRWQDLFTGADPELMNKQNGGVANTNELAKMFWRETPEARREALMPFVWNVIAKKGQVFGNLTKGSVAHITNTRKFSYPGYNETLTGFANAEIRSNAKIPNQNATVLEWLHKKSGFKDSVVAFSAWDVMPFIINRERCGFPVMGGWEPVPEKSPSERQQLLNQLIGDTTRENEAELTDSILFQAAMEHLKAHHPRVLFVSLLETDHWGHAGRYDRVLQTAHKVDDYVRRLYEYTQSIPQYRDQTSIIMTADHGRGVAPENWKNHGEKIDGAENIWMTFLGPDTPALGERTNCPAVTQSQVAATLAALLGEDYNKDVSQAGKPIRDVLPQTQK